MQQSAKVKPFIPEGIIYAFSQPPKPGAIRQVAPSVYWLRMPLPFALEHINLWLLDDGDGWTIVDCGFGTDETRALWDGIFASCLNGKPVRRIVITHFHPDHFGLAAWLADKWRAPVLMTRPEYAAAQAWHTSRELFTRSANFELFKKHGLQINVDGAPPPRENLFRRGVPAIPSSVIPLDDGAPLNINGRKWRVVTGYGHSPEHAALVCDELGVLIAGDMVLPRISTNVSVQPNLPDADPLGQFLDSLTRYAALDADTLVLPSHGLPFHGLRPRIQALHDHHALRLDELLVACAAPRTGAELMPVIFKRALDPQQTFFAMGETLSHLNYLQHRGRLARTCGEDGIYRYSRA